MIKRLLEKSIMLFFVMSCLVLVANNVAADPVATRLSYPPATSENIFLLFLFNFSINTIAYIALYFITLKLKMSGTDFAKPKNVLLFIVPICIVGTIVGALIDVMFVIGPNGITFNAINLTIALSLIFLYFFGTSKSISGIKAMCLMGGGMVLVNIIGWAIMYISYAPPPIIYTSWLVIPWIIILGFLPFPVCITLLFLFDIWHKDKYLRSDVASPVPVRLKDMANTMFIETTVLCMIGEIFVLTAFMLNETSSFLFVAGLYCFVCASPGYLAGYYCHRNRAGCTRYVDLFGILSLLYIPVGVAFGILGMLAIPLAIVFSVPVLLSNRKIKRELKSGVNN